MIIIFICKFKDEAAGCSLYYELKDRCTKDYSTRLNMYGDDNFYSYVSLKIKPRVVPCATNWITGVPKNIVQDFRIKWN